MDLLLFFNFLSKHMFAIIANKNVCLGMIILISDGERLIFHIDINSAYLSWTAVKILQYGSALDIREVHSVIGGNEENRHGIILAASIPAKKFGIRIGESIFEAKQKCNNLLIYPPDYNWYVKSSNAMVEILNEYSTKIQRYSIDECFMNYSHQGPLENTTDSTNEIFNGIKKIFIEMYRGEKIWQIGIRLTKLCNNEYYQGTLFDFEKIEKQKKIDEVMDFIRKKYGKEAVIGSCFIHSGIKSLS